MFTWFDLAWPWVGLGFAAGLAVLLFATDRLRADPTIHRRDDLGWLSFLAVPVYLVHQVEEYGIAANGVPHAFPDALCAALGQPRYPGCAIPPVFFLAVNLSLVWVAAPLAALFAQRFPLVGLAAWGTIAVNAVVHIAVGIATLSYDPGLVTAIVLFVPLSAMTAVAAFGRAGRLRASAAPLLIGAGVLTHAVLAGGLLLFLRGVVPAWLLIAAQPAGIAAAYLVVGRADGSLVHPTSSA